MFGLTFEKLLVITIISGFVIGPRRLPVYAGQLAAFVRDLRGFIETTRARAETELGVRAVDLRDYDPRRIVRNALEAPVEPAEEQLPSNSEPRTIV
ncbi:hypothetical protein OJ998_00730 [Solirubrobacter taibaiensis]|nr:hypothetical protein [Solirubrobacter taibaiensis]